MSFVKENMERLWGRIEKAASGVGRSSGEITLVAVSKGVEVEKIRKAIDAGIKIIGENRLQEARAKHQELKGEGIEWHLVGHLQRNKAKKAISLFDLIQSGDRIELLEEINRHSQNLGKAQRILLQVNTSQDLSKGGFRPGQIRDLLGQIPQFSHLQIEGLMCIGPLTDDEGRIRNSFRILKELFEEIKQQGIEGFKMRYLSMGMSQDFELAIEEGSNMIRIGRAIFE